MHPITIELKKHYKKAFDEFGPTAQGVDWKDKKTADIRYEKMLAVIENDCNNPKILDVGCGYGGLYNYAQEKDVKLDYFGIDVCENMIEYAKSSIKNATFINNDIFQHNFTEKFDYVVCNGILTQKLNMSQREMDEFAKILIKKMFSLAERGIAFNIMTTKVNFMVNNLYYKSPVEILGYCFNEITPKFRIDHHYPQGFYEYTLYLYRESL